MSDKLKTLDMHAVERLFGAILDKPAPQAEAVGLLNGKPNAELTELAKELQSSLADIADWQDWPEDK